MKRYIFWNVLNKHVNIALTEDLSKYAQGETFWQAMLNLCDSLKEWIPSQTHEESNINARLKMYYETGVNKIELFVEEDGQLYSVKCANTRSHIDAGSIEEALMKYVASRAKTSVINTGEVPDG